MDNHDLNIWLLKRIQTESSLRSEERRLDAAKTEYNSERFRYQNAKESFQSTKLRLLNDKVTAENPQVALDKAKSDTSKLKEHKEKVDILNDRLCVIEGKVKRQSVLVLQNKKKLEILEERINIMHGRKAAKKNFKEELEILDSRIQQIVLSNQKNKDLKIKETEKEISEIKDSEEAALTDELQPEVIKDQNFIQLINDTTAISSESLNSAMSNSSREQSHNHNNNQFFQTQMEPEKRSNKEFYEQIQNLTYLRNDEVDHLNLRYYNKSGNVFELNIKKQTDQGYIIEIKPHSKLDTLSLNNSKSEIIENLKSQGLRLNKITVKEYGNA